MEKILETFLKHMKTEITKGEDISSAISSNLQLSVHIATFTVQLIQHIMQVPKEEAIQIFKQAFCESLDAETEEYAEFKQSITF